jgi:hypothetical protein
VAFDGTNYLVVWDDWHQGSGSFYDIYGSRVSAGGSVLDPAGISISTAPHDQVDPAVAFDGTNYLVAWQDTRNNGPDDIYGARVSVGGSLLDPTGFAISTAGNEQWSPSLAFDGNNYFVTWMDHRSGNSYGIYGARVSVGGSVLDPDGIAISTASKLEAYTPIARGPLGSLFIAYTSLTGPPYGTYHIWGKAWNGSPTEVTDGISLPPRSATLEEASPNPFGAATTIRYGLPKEANVKLLIYDVAGRLVSVLADQKETAGYHTVTWNGIRSDGRAATSGAYICRLETNGRVVSRKTVLLR